MGLTKWKQILMEMVFMVLMQFTTNICLLIPLLITGFSVKARHVLIIGALGNPFPEEDHAYWLVTTLMWALPLTIFLAAIVDIGFVYIYMKKAHPWSGILE